MAFHRLDIVIRLKALLPARWFAEDTPILDAILAALAAGWSGFFNFFDYAASQVRIGTSYGFWLDLVAGDFFGNHLKRREQEPDELFRRRITQELVRDRCTRAALYQVLYDLTGETPNIFEPSNPHDTGCYGLSASSGKGTAGFGIGGAWGSLYLPFQAFVTTTRPKPLAISTINGWGGSVGGYGVGIITYTDQKAITPAITDRDIYNSIKGVAPAGSKIWTAIRS